MFQIRDPIPDEPTQPHEPRTGPSHAMTLYGPLRNSELACDFFLGEQFLHEPVSLSTRDYLVVC